MGGVDAVVFLAVYSAVVRGLLQASALLFCNLGFCDHSPLVLLAFTLQFHFAFSFSGFVGIVFGVP